MAKRTETMAETLEIELDRKRFIVLDTEALLAIEEALNVNTLKEDFWENMSTKRARVVLWAGLLHDDPGLKFEDMKNVLRGQALGLIMAKLLEAWGLMKPQKDAEENGSADPQQPEAPISPSAGTTSGPSLGSTSS